MKMNNTQDINVPEEIRGVLKAKLINGSVYFAETPVTIGQYNEVRGLKVEGNPACPVTEVSFSDAALFLNELSKQENLEQVYDIISPDNIVADNTKNGWRLPEFKEWKLAAGEPEINNDTAWFLDNSDDVIHECKTKAPNKNGLYDMYGLVWEICADVKNKKYNILAGGAWDCPADFCSNTYYQKAVQGFKSDATGFRGVRNK